MGTALSCIFGLNLCAFGQSEAVGQNAVHVPKLTRGSLL